MPLGCGAVLPPGVVVVLLSGVVVPPGVVGVVPGAVGSLGLVGAVVVLLSGVVVVEPVVSPMVDEVLLSLCASPRLWCLRD